ncbi:hypothetical protein [Paludibaculum fermentans]|uniref:hypothetical protein n=1 Tax=Paludibaculum fermentans TaxID=1473598 RepID=UPI003EC0E177
MLRSSALRFPSALAIARRASWPGIFLLLLSAAVRGQETPRVCPSPSGSNSLVAGELVTCSVTAVSGHEWTFDAQASELYSIGLLETAGGGSHPVVTVFDPSGTQIVTADTSLQLASLVRTTSRGRYRMTFTEGRTAGSFDPYTYTMSFERVGVPTASAPYMPLGLQFASSIEPPGDRDLYKLNVEAGDVLRFRFARTHGSGTQEAMLVDSLGAARLIGSGYVVPATGVYSLILQDSAVYSSRGTVSLECQGACPGPPAVSSLFPHYAEGAGWSSTMMFLNNNDLPVKFKLWTRSSDGLDGSVYEGAIAPHGLAGVTSTLRPEDPLWQGSNILIAPQGVSGMLVFRSAEVPGQRGQQAASVLSVPTGSNAWILPFDNQNGYLSGLAITALASTATAFTLDSSDANGGPLESRTITLNPNGHMAFVLTDQLPATANKRGLVQIRAGAGVSIGVVGLRFSPQGAFTSLAPAALSTTATVPGSIAPPSDQYYFVPHIANGGGWSTELFAFSRDRAASGVLKLASYQGTGTAFEGFAPKWTGSGAAWPVTYDSLGTRSTVESLIGQNMLALKTAGSEAGTSVGWLSAARAGDFAGLAIFRQTVDGAGRIAQEASVPFFPSNVSQFWVPLDQRNGTVGLALANPSSTQSRSVSIVFRDYNGDVAGQTSFTMPPMAHFATTIDTLIPAAAGGIGSIEVNSSNGDIAGIGLLFEGTAFTALPALR